MAKTAVLFDFDGTLFYGTTIINYHSFNMALEEMGRKTITMEEANATVGDKIPNICRRLLDTDDPVLCQELYDGISRFVPIAIQKYAEIEPECVEMLKTLSQHAPLAICSNGEKGYLMSLLEKFEILPYFSYVWHSKPGYNKASAIPELKKILGVDQAIMVGDRGEDVQSGKANGCITVALQNYFGARDALNADYDVYDHVEMKNTILDILSKG